MHISSLVMLCVLSANSSSTLPGRVVDELNQPLQNATVSVYSASAKPGMPPTNVAYYQDLTRQWRTNDKGEFAINQLDTNMMFRLLVLAPGRRGVLSDLIDPASTSLSIQLQKLPQDLPVNQVLKGVVLTIDGKPIPNAIVTAPQETPGDGKYGQKDVANSIAVTDTDGTFSITSEAFKVGMYLRIFSAGYSITNTPLLNIASKTNEIRLAAEAELSGRLLLNGVPAPNRYVAISNGDSSHFDNFGQRVERTDEQGRFNFSQLKPNQKYVVFSLIDGIQHLSYAGPHFVTTGSKDEPADVGDLLLKEGVAFSGKIIMPDGDRLPQNAKIYAIQDFSANSILLPVSEDGHFHFQGLRKEVYLVYVYVPGYEIDLSQLPHQSTGDDEFAVSLRKREGVVKTSIALKKKP